MILGCGDFIKTGIVKEGCCESCHQDDEVGYPICEYYPEAPNKNGKESKISLNVCCRTAKQLPEDIETRAVFAKVLRAARPRHSPDLALRDEPKGE